MSDDPPTLHYALGPNEDSFYLWSGSRAVSKSLPVELSNLLLNDERFKPDNILFVDLLPNGGYFIITNEGVADWLHIPKQMLAFLEKKSLPMLDVVES